MTGIIDLEKLNVSQKKEEMTVPLSYLPFQLSTGGKLGVPETIYCRNFNTEDILTLSMLANSIMPERMVSVLNSIMYEQVNVAEWPDQCIIELLVRIYTNFFTPILPQVAFPWDNTDVEWLTAKGDLKKVEALKSKMWVPRVDIDLRTLNIKQVEDKVTNTLSISKKDKEGNVTFSMKFLSYPRYGDTLILRKFTQERFGEVEKKYASIELLFDTYTKYFEEEKDTSSLPTLDTDLYFEWQEFLLTKNVFVSSATLALYLLEVNGQDVANLPIDEKIAILKDPNFDINFSKKLDKYFGMMEFGIDPNVVLVNPITGETTTRRFLFRLNDILQAIQSYDPDGYDVAYE